MVHSLKYLFLLANCVMAADLNFPASAQAVSPEATTPSCPPQIIRWLENCAHLRGKRLTGTSALRYIPLTEDGDIYLTLGGQLRARWEAQDAVDFGILNAPDTESIGGRALLHGDLRFRSGFRVFAQASFVQEDGRNPGPRPFDESDPDITQLFAELSLQASSTKSILRIGRQELPLGGNRLAGLRDGVFLRRSFDAVRIDTSFSKSWSGSAFVASPVQIQPGAFDDRRTDGETFAGLTAAKASDLGTTSVFVLHRGHNQAVFASAAGEETRTMVGAHINYAFSDLTLNAQGGVQIGDLGDQDILAWGVGVDIGWTPDPAIPIKIGSTFGATSGDGDPQDGRSENFDPFYPNLSVFSVAPLYYPTNQINVGVYGSYNLTPRLTAKLGSVLLMRNDTDDAIYSVSGRPLDTPSRERISALLGDIRLTWRLNDYVTIDGAYLRAGARRAVRAAGGDDVNYAMFELTTTF